MRHQCFKLKQRFPTCGARPRVGGGPLMGRKLFYEVNFGRKFSWLKYCTHRLVPVPASNYKQHILSPAKVRKYVTH
jgi:hypothetical protein